MVNDQLTEKLAYYRTTHCQTTQDEAFDLLGFTDLKAVVTMSTSDSKKLILGKLNLTNIKKEQLPTTTLKTDQSGGKYIHLNGQKLKVVPQSFIPKEIKQCTMVLKHQMVDIGNLNKPLKIRVISSVSHLNNSDTHSTDKIDKPKLVYGSHKNDNQIRNKHINPDSGEITKHTESSSSTAESVKPKASLNCAQVDSEPPEEAELYQLIPFSSRVVPKLLTTKNIEILNKVKMQALNLSTKDLNKSDVKKKEVTDSSVQTDIVTTKDQNVQTDTPASVSMLDRFDEKFLRWLDSDDMPIINNINLGESARLRDSPVLGNCVNRSVSGTVIVNEEKMSKKLNFFKDLKNCLTPNAVGNMPIHEGVINNDLMLVKRMCAVLKALRRPVDLENHNGCTPLQLAVIHNSSPEIVDVLLNFGADVGEADGEGNTILHMGARFGRHQILKVILSHPVFSSVNNRPLIDSFNFDGLTPLMICCLASWTEGVYLFVNHRAEVNLRDQTSGRTALFHASEAHSEEIVRFLLNNRADPKIKNFFGTSPHDAMYELDEIPFEIKNLIFGKTKKRTIEAEMNPARTAKAVKTLKTFSKLQKVESSRSVLVPIIKTYNKTSQVK